MHNATCAKVLVDGPGYHEKDNKDRFAVLLSMLDLSKCDYSTYPLPRIDDILDTIAQAKYFTTLDLSAGYWQVNVDPSS